MNLYFSYPQGNQEYRYIKFIADYYIDNIILYITAYLSKYYLQ